MNPPIKILSLLAIGGLAAGSALAGPGNAGPGEPTSALAYQPEKTTPRVQIALYRAPGDKAVVESRQLPRAEQTTLPVGRLAPQSQ
jgi:hypothetical protein